MRNLGVVFSGRLQSFLLWLLGLWMIMFLSTMAWQVVASYIAGEGFDTGVFEFWTITLVFFVPYLFVAGYMLRSLAAQIALYRTLRRQIVIAEYEPPRVLSPVEAGMLADDDFSLSELAATLKNLELRGHISIEEREHEFNFVLQNKNGLDVLETTFMNSLFQRDRSFSTSGPNSSRRLLSAGEVLASATRSELIYAGQLPRGSIFKKFLRAAFRFFLGFAVLVQILLTAGVVAAPEKIFSIGYPRFPMHLSEPILIVGIIVATIAFIASGFWMRKITDDNGLKNWRYVAGLKLYLDQVYKGRFYRDGKLTVSQGELRTFYPYAIALDVEREFTRKLERALLL